MADSNQPKPGILILDRVSFKLIALFVVTFVLFFIGLSAYGIFISMWESRDAEAGVVMDESPVIIDPRIQSDLERVLTAENQPAANAVKDPFSDRAGLSDSAPPTANTGATQVGVSNGGGNSTSAGTVAVGPGSTGQGTAVPPPPSAVEATKLRYLNWLDRTMAGEPLALDPMIFAIEDLLPVGLVSGGSGQNEVMFFSQSADRTVSFPVGARFNDGWLTAVRPEGVVFSFDDLLRTVRMKSWGRSVKSKYSRNLSIGDDSGQSVLSGKNR